MENKKLEHKIKRRARVLIAELDRSGGLEVCLVPAPDPRHSGHKIRVACSTNPLWYRQFSRRYQSTRGKMKRPRTFIRRDHTRRALIRLSEGDFRGIYAERLIRFISARWRLNAEPGEAIERFPDMPF